MRIKIIGLLYFYAILDPSIHLQHIYQAFGSILDNGPGKFFSC
jgi:hypothetical protein